MPLTVLIAPSGFKECLDADAVCENIATGVRRAAPDARVIKAPLVDGGEGFTRALVAATGGELRDVVVTGPVGDPVESHFGLLGGDCPRTAVLEMAAAAGLALVPRDLRDPAATTTRGVGELIGHALDAGAKRILLGCGDSGTNDGGAGMAQALGFRLLDAGGEELEPGGAALARLATIDAAGRDKRLEEVQIDVACNAHNVLCGEHGVARVFGPQKGASPEAVEQLAGALDIYAEVLRGHCGREIGALPGSGASGGLGAGLDALLGATLHPRYEIVMQYLELDEHLAVADLVLTAEGSIDFQTPRGKIPAEVGRRAAARGVPVIALAGTIGDRPQDNYDAGITAFDSILQAPCGLDHAIEHAPELLRHCAEKVLRMVLIGRDLPPTVPTARSRPAPARRSTRNRCSRPRGSR